MMALVYFLIASRVVREAREAEEAAATAAAADDEASGAPDGRETPS
jgi:hypothetical protein